MNSIKTPYKMEKQILSGLAERKLRQSASSF